MQAFDPVSIDEARHESPGVTYCDSPYSCAAKADALVIVTEWEQFRALGLTRLKKEMAQPVIVDLRNINRPDEMAEHGFTMQASDVGGVAGFREASACLQQLLINADGLDGISYPQRLPSNDD